MNQPIHIVQLYPKDMNIYGDYGNVLTLVRRLEWHGFFPIVTEYNVGDSLPKDVDILVGGGGQDSGQDSIHADLLAIGPRLKQLADDGTPMLMVCGLYQLFGHFFETSAKKRITGIGIFDCETFAMPERLIGNIVTTSPDFDEIIGYENHSGQTFLGDDATPLATVVKGAGNNSRDAHEGIRYNNAIGTYLHGSLLPKNPRIADFLIEQAVTRRYGKFTPVEIDDRLAELAREAARTRPR
jgi:lipid II isoglutaminyl synthase (glutamine-hydrolysing)